MPLVTIWAVGDVVTTEQRGLVIRKIPQHAQERPVDKLPIELVGRLNQNQPGTLQQSHRVESVAIDQRARDQRIAEDTLPGYEPVQQRALADAARPVQLRQPRPGRPASQQRGQVVLYRLARLIPCLSRPVVLGSPHRTG